MNDLLDGIDVQKIQLALYFIAPGFIILYFRSLFVAGRVLSIKQGVVAYLTISSIYQAIIFPSITALKLYEVNLQAFVWIAANFLLPALVGVLLGINIQKGWAQHLLDRLNINLVHPIETAWDWHFSRCGYCWILVVLKDGTKWAGNVQGQSFMSSNIDNRDIFIEKVYTIDDENNWEQRSSSVWLDGKDIQSIEFWPQE
jgi:hypothetical protein